MIREKCVQTHFVNLTAQMGEWYLKSLNANYKGNIIFLEKNLGLK
jgi:hypothetical protein